MFTLSILLRAVRLRQNPQTTASITLVDYRLTSHDVSTPSTPPIYPIEQLVPQESLLTSRSLWYLKSTF